jgi:hypothetical protein
VRSICVKQIGKTFSQLPFGSTTWRPTVEHGKAKPGMNNHHFDRGPESDVDPATWNRASYNHHPCDDLEPIDLVPNSYREAALHFLGIMYAIDQFWETAPDARAAAVAVAIVLQWPSTRGLSVPEIAGQLGTTPATIARACARFSEIAGLHAGGVRFIRPGAGSNGDKPAAVRA